jgi:Ca2+-transporting ATPase
MDGLSGDEAARLLREDGPNDILSGARHTVLQNALDILKEPMFLLLVFAGAIYLIIGDLQEALILMSFVLLVMGITFFQKRRTEKALEALRDLSSPRAMVIRDGRRTRIAGVEVVRGDILVLSEGDRVPADAVVIDCANLMVDESLLTGESLPVRKVSCDGSEDMGRPGGDSQPCVYAGTLVVSGHGLALAKATGPDTEMGKIGVSLEEIKREATPLQRETRQAVRNIALAGLALFVLVVVVYGISRDDWLGGLLVGITLAMAVLPEEFPVIYTVFLTLGAWRISKKHVLTRDMPAVETLGSATVLCVDKTGTLTLNRMTASVIIAHGSRYRVDRTHPGEMPEKFHELVEFGVLASQRNGSDPVEKALVELGERALQDTEHIHEDWMLEREYPLSPQLMALSHVWRSPDENEYVIAAKGAPEAVADLCHLDDAQFGGLSRQIEDLASDGLRMLGVAKASFTTAYLPKDQHDFGFNFLGLIGLRDPIRPTVKGSVEECYEAGMRIIMITGDYSGTALNVAGRIGLKPDDQVISGMELDRMDEEELRERIKKTSIFARVVPGQKTRIVRALQANGEVVAMTGDGVNDAPALKAADIGVAMGDRGTDVAREASALVLLDDDFSSIESAARMGRRIYDNLKKAVSYVIAIHVPIAGMSIIPVLFRLPLVFAPIHIAFLEMIIDPACSLIFEAEPEHEDVMRRPPRRPDERIFNRRNLSLSVLQGLNVLLIVSMVFLISLVREVGEGEVRAMTFTTLIIANLALILTNRSWNRTIRETMGSPNAVLWWIVGGTLCTLAVALYVPFARRLFMFEPLSLVDMGICLAAGCLSVVWFEAFKVLSRRKGQANFFKKLT